MSDGRGFGERVLKPRVMTKSQETKLFVLFGLFLSGLIAANLLGVKITSLFSEKLRVSVGIFAYPITFLVTDIVAEVFGKEKSKKFVLAGIFALVLLFLLTALSVWLPAHQSYLENNDAYETIFNASLRMTIASLVAFILSQINDIWAFHLLKRKTKGRYLWLRNNLSTIISQLIDTSVFMFIAFYQITPDFNVPFIISLIIPYWIFKIIFAILDTPLVYLGVWWLKKK